MTHWANSPADPPVQLVPASLSPRVKRPGRECGFAPPYVGDRGSTVVKVLCYSGTAVAQWLRCCATSRKVASSIPAGVSGFFIDKILPHYGPGVDSASNRNEYQEYFLGGKGGRCVRLTTLSPSCAVVTKSGNRNFLWACPGL